MHRKRVTSELHDSYFCLMTIKHSISKIQWAIVWALNYYIIQLSLGPRAVASRIPDSYRPDVLGKATPDRGGSRKPPIEWARGLRLNNRRTRKTQRDSHNSGVKIWSLCSVSSPLSNANPWTTLSNPCNKVRGKYVVKEVFLRPLFVRLSFIMHLLSLRRYVSSIYICMQHIFQTLVEVETAPSRFWSCVTSSIPNDDIL